jgi:hypothetical protein
MVKIWEITIFKFYLCQPQTILRNKWHFKFFIKNIYLQIMPLNHFFGEEMCFESLLNNDIKRYFFSNDLKFGIFMYYACVEFWQNFKE